MAFEKLEERLVLSGKVEALTPIHIGSGKGERDIGEVDLPILRQPSGVPYIPGSSLKGKVRSEAERIARKRGMQVCTPPEVRNMCGSIKKDPKEFCICCRIFGTAGDISVASKVKFRDSYPDESIERTLTRTGIAMDREKGSVYKQALYTIEAVPAGTKFSLEIVAENMAEEELGLLRAALRSVEDSALGGSSTRGFGKVKFHFLQLRKRSAGFYLGKGDEQVIEGKELEEWMNRK
jgi:CRISPR-associated protein Csm3